MHEHFEVKRLLTSLLWLTHWRLDDPRPDIVGFKTGG